MDIVLMTVGKTRIGFVADGIMEYSRRLARYVPFGVSELPDVRSTRAMTEEQQKEREGSMILDKISPADFVVLLDAVSYTHLTLPTIA